MIDIDNSELVEVGLKAAAQVEGLGKIERVKVVTRLDESDQPAYYFRFMTDDFAGRGLAFTRLGMKIRDELIARGDDRYPYISVMSRSDWEKREGA